MTTKRSNPWKTYKTTHATKFGHVEIAGWGGGKEEIQGVITVSGLMNVDLHDASLLTGLLHFTCEKECKTQNIIWAQNFHGAKQIGKVWYIPKGSRFYVHSSHIRALNVAQKGE